MFRSVRRLARTASTLSVAAVALCLAAPVLASVASLNGVAVLPAGDRASLVVEASDAVPSVSQSAPDPTTLIIEAGPMSGPMSPQELVPDSELPCIAGVLISGHTDLKRGPFLRVRIRLLSACRGVVRSHGRRIYVDLAAAGAARPVPPPSISAPPTRAATPVVAEIDHEAVRSDILRRARTLAAQADVKGLIRLRDEADRKLERLGKQRPELLSQLLGDLDGLTNDARALRLKLDGIAFKKEEERLNPKFPPE